MMEKKREWRIGMMDEANSDVIWQASEEITFQGRERPIVAAGWKADRVAQMRAEEMLQCW